MEHTNIFLRIALLAHIAKDNELISKYRLLHPVTWFYLPFLLVAAYRWIQIIPTLHIKDFFCWW